MRVAASCSMIAAPTASSARVSRRPSPGRNGLALRRPPRAVTAASSSDARPETLHALSDPGEGQETRRGKNERLSTAHGSSSWRAFTAAATGDWGGCCVAFDGDGVAMDIPLRYVHGVGRVPAVNMPFRDVVTDWMTKCVVSCTEDGVEVASKRAMPEIGNEDAISSCGGSEWGEDVAYVEDEPLRILRGGDEDKTISPVGAFSAGARALPAAAGATTAVQHCLVDPNTGRRVRVIQRVASGEDATWETVSTEVWIEEKKACVAPFAADPAVSAEDLADEAWTSVPERAASFRLAWPDPPRPDAKDGGSAFVALEEAGNDRSVGPTWSRARGRLSRLPGGVWVFCGQGGDDGEEVVLEAGWMTSGGERMFAARRYDASSGRLTRVALGCERR